MPIVSVFGSNGNIEPEVEALSEKLGELILNLGCRLCCGGRGGVMEAVCRGAKESSNWSGGEIIGILPESDDRNANPHLDIVLPTGIGYSRNMLVAHAGDVCIAISGGAGTLSEIAFAWQIGKPIAVMSTTGGWSEKLADEHLDHRRDDAVVGLSNIEDAEAWLRVVLSL
jgi:uncharacterized protein (TIGR00725 family)